MFEFNTPEDAQAVAVYHGNALKARGYEGFACIDINRLAEIHEDYSKLVADTCIFKIMKSSHYE